MNGHGQGIAECEQEFARLARELACLVDLGVLNAEEVAAFLAVQERFAALLAGIRRGEEPDSFGRPMTADLQELIRTASLLSTDLDLAFQRLCVAV